MADVIIKGLRLRLSDGFAFVAGATEDFGYCIEPVALNEDFSSASRATCSEALFEPAGKVPDLVVAYGESGDDCGCFAGTFAIELDAQRS